MPLMRQLSFDGFHEWYDPPRPTVGMKLANCVSGRRGAKRSERSEDGTPAARDPPEGGRTATLLLARAPGPRAGHAQRITPRLSPALPILPAAD
jgi:hypothetical protein